MSNELKLTLAKDREYVSPSDRQVLVAIGLQSAGGGIAGAGAEHFQGLELALTVDCSGSMKDPESGSGVGPSKLDQAIKAVWSTVDKVGPRDVLSIIAFDEKPEIVLRRVSGRERGKLRDSAAQADVEAKLRGFGGRTNILGALELSRSVLSQRPDTVRRIVLLSDGLANEPQRLGNQRAIMDATLQYAEQLGSEGVVLDPLGYGFGKDLRFDFLSALANPTGSEREHVQSSPDAVFQRIFSGARKVYASHVELAITVPPRVKMGDIYRFEPQIMYLGSAPVTATERTVRLRAGQLQSGKAYSWIFETEAPRGATGQILLGEVTLAYRLSDGSRHHDQGTINVEMTNDAALAARRDGNYTIFYEQAKLNKLEKELGDAQTQRDARKMVQLLEYLMKRCRELGLDDEAARYERIFASFQEDRDFVRAAIAAATTSTSSKSRPSDYIREGGLDAAPSPPPKPHRPKRPRRRRR
jgi:Mg-chelatase subunit ChlD